MFRSLPVKSLRTLRRSSLSGALAIGLLAAPGCQCPVRQRETYPVIDVHAHTFNALSMPVHAVVAGRAEEKWPGNASAARAVRVLADAIVVTAWLNQHLGVGPSLDEVAEKAETTSMAELAGVTPAIVSKALAQLDRQKELSFAALSSDLKSVVLTDFLLRDENWAYFAEALAGINIERPRAGEKATEWRRTVLGFARFIRVLTGSDRTAYRRLQEAFSGRVGLFVNQTMDLGPSYGVRQSSPFFWDFSRTLENVRQLDQAACNRGLFVHFVAFNPFRGEKKKPAGGWKDSVIFQDLERAIAHGAWGVKFYPPSGYRPSQNVHPPRPTTPILGAQWDSRYQDRSPADLDEICDALFAYCQREAIPVFAHCEPGEFEAATGYGTHMAAPSFYTAVLDKYPRLRLCFGHAGGPSHWFGDDAQRAKNDWGATVIKLCAEKDFVFCEVGVMTEILDSGGTDTFRKRLLAAIDTHGARFSSKIMYGSDWFMPATAGAGGSFLTTYEDLFRTDPALVDFHDAFFCLNALNFLGISPRAAKIDARIAPTMREPLADLIARAQAGPRK